MSKVYATADDVRKEWDAFWDNPSGDYSGELVLLLHAYADATEKLRQEAVATSSTGFGPSPADKLSAKIPRRDYNRESPLVHTVIGVANPPGVEPGTYYAVTHKASGVRVSVWFKSFDTAWDRRNGWAEEYGEGDQKPVATYSTNMVWEDQNTWADGCTAGGPV